MENHKYQFLFSPFGGTKGGFLLSPLGGVGGGL